MTTTKKYPSEKQGDPKRSKDDDSYYSNQKPTYRDNRYHDEEGTFRSDRSNKQYSNSYTSKPYDNEKYQSNSYNSRSYQETKNRDYDYNYNYTDKKGSYNKNIEDSSRGYGKKDNDYNGSAKGSYGLKDRNYQSSKSYKAPFKETRESGDLDGSVIHYQKEEKGEVDAKDHADKQTKTVRFSEQNPETNKESLKEKGPLNYKTGGTYSKNDSKGGDPSSRSVIEYVKKEDPTRLQANQNDEKQKTPEVTGSIKNKNFFEEKEPTSHSVETTTTQTPHSQSNTKNQSNNSSLHGAPQATGTTQSIPINTNIGPQVSYYMQPQAGSLPQFQTQQQPQNPLIFQQQAPLYVPYNPLSVISSQGQKELPPIFQMPYIVFPLSNGTAIVQPLYVPNGYNPTPLGLMNPFGSNFTGYIPHTPNMMAPQVSEQDLINLMKAIPTNKN